MKRLIIIAALLASASGVNAKEKECFAIALRDAPGLNFGNVHKRGTRTPEPLIAYYRIQKDDSRAVCFVHGDCIEASGKCICGEPLTAKAKFWSFSFNLDVTRLRQCDCCANFFVVRAAPQRLS
jgi:hypothetical protein